MVATSQLAVKERIRLQPNMNCNAVTRYSLSEAVERLLVMNSTFIYKQKKTGCVFVPARDRHLPNFHTLVVHVRKFLLPFHFLLKRHTTTVGRCACCGFSTRGRLHVSRARRLGCRLLGQCWLSWCLDRSCCRCRRGRRRCWLEATNTLGWLKVRRNRPVHVVFIGATRTSHHEHG